MGCRKPCNVSNTPTKRSRFPIDNSSEPTERSRKPAATHFCVRREVASLATSLPCLQWGLQMLREVIGGYNEGNHFMRQHKKAHGRVPFVLRQPIVIYIERNPFGGTQKTPILTCRISSDITSEATMSSSNGAAPHCRLFWLVALHTSYLRRLQWALQMKRRLIVRVFDVSHSMLLNSVDIFGLSHLVLLHSVGYNKKPQITRIINRLK